MKQRIVAPKPEPFDYRLWVEDRVAEAAEEWWRLQCRDMFLHLHLYYRPSTLEQPGALTVAAEPPAGFVLADPRRISPAWTKPQAQRFISDVSRRLPILPFIR